MTLMRTESAVLLAMLAFFWSVLPARSAARKVSPAPALGQPVAFPGGVMVSPGQVYATIRGFRPLTLDLYQIQAKAKTPPRPAILFVHGGLWSGGDARHAGGFDDFPALLAALAAKNYVVASVNYRLAGEARFPAAVQDVKSAVRWLRVHAGDYDLDTTRVMVWGQEAGGQIASLVGASCGVTTLEPAADATAKAPLVSDCVQGVIDWAGPADLASWEPDRPQAQPEATPSPLGAYMGCEPADCAPGVVKAASPITYLDSMTPPFLIQQGAADTLVPVAQSRALYEALEKLHVPSTLAIYPDAGEDFTKDGVADPAIQAKVIADMEDFIAKTFPSVPLAKKEKASSPRKRRR